MTAISLVFLGIAIWAAVSALGEWWARRDRD